MKWLTPELIKEVMESQRPLKKSETLLMCKNCKKLFKNEKWKVWTKYCSMKCYKNKSNPLF